MKKAFKTALWWTPVLLQNLAVQMKIWSIKFCENILRDPEDVERMSSELVMVCASDDIPGSY